MKITKYEKLPPGYYMLWRVDNKEDTPEDIISYFTDKYGYIPTEVLVGDKVELEFSSYIKKAKFQVPDFHVKLR